MPYMDTFNSIVTTTKKNNRYFGPTESKKMASFLSEVKSDLDTLFREVNDLRTNFDALSLSYFEASEDPTKLDNIRRAILELSEKVNARFYVEGSQVKVF